MRKHLLAVLVVFSFARLALAQSSDAASGADATIAGLGKAVGITEAAKVAAVDRKNHTVTLQAPDGASQTYQTSKHLNLKKVKVGDSVVVHAVDAVAVSLRGPKSGPAGATGTGMAVEGKNDVGVADTVRVVAKIRAIDTTKPSVTLEGPAGGRLVVKAKSAQDLQGLKVGDDLDVTYTEAVVADLVPPAK